MAMTAWDLGMDPQMTARGHWVWTQGGAYFGIPVHNFVGWLATTFVVFLLFYLFESRQPARAIQFTEPFARLAVIAYGVQGTATVIASAAGNQRAVAMITFFAMGSFFLMALSRILATRGKS
jgi:putative membrane protein